MFIFDLLTQETPDGSLGSTLAGIVEQVPHQPSRITDLGLYQIDPLLSTTVAFDVTDLGLELVQTSTRGGAKSYAGGETRGLVYFPAAHLTKSAKITDADIRDLRAVGAAQFEAAKNALLRKVRNPVGSVRATLEYHRLGGIRNLILDADGSVIDSMYVRFGINGGVAPAPIYLDLGNLATTGFPFRDKCGEIVDRIADALGGSGFDHVHSFVTSATMRKIAGLRECETAFQRQQDGAFLREGKGYGTVFEYGGVTFETYRGKVGSVDFVSNDEFVFFPVGAGNLYQGFAPATRIVDPFTGQETEEGRIGQPEFYLPYRDPRGEFEELEIQSNPVTVNLRPLSTVIAVAGAEPVEPEPEPEVPAE